MIAARVYHPMSLRTVRVMLQRGIVSVDPITADVWSRGKRLRQLRDDEGYLFVRLHWRGMRRAIAVHKLVWISVHGRVPRGKELHHRDFTRTHNCYTNLQPLTRKQHQRLHRTEAEANGFFLNKAHGSF